MAYEEPKTAELIGGGGEDDDNERGNNHCKDGVEEKVTEPEANRVRQAVGQLHGLYGRAALFRDVKREERRVHSLSPHVSHLVRGRYCRRHTIAAPKNATHFSATSVPAAIPGNVW